MNNRNFAIWLATHGYTQRRLAAELGINEDSITNYKKRQRFPKWFSLALKGIEAKKIEAAE